MNKKNRTTNMNMEKSSMIRSIAGIIIQKKVNSNKDNTVNDKKKWKGKCNNKYHRLHIPKWHEENQNLWILK